MVLQSFNTKRCRRWRTGFRNQRLVWPYCLQTKIPEECEPYLADKSKQGDQYGGLILEIGFGVDHSDHSSWECQDLVLHFSGP